jgi:hypothetical protein
MTPVLYILMRTDLDSMNPGKAMAQASHASNAFVNHEILDGTFGIASNMREDWKHQTEQGFGTVLVLGVTESQMRTAVTVATVSNFVSGIVHDPTYPLRDGDTTHFIPLDTCGYVFGDKDDLLLQSILGNFELHY